MDDKPKDRANNFTQEEINLLKSLVDKYKTVLLNKRINAFHVKQKEDTWVAIFNEYNASCPQNKFRSLKQLRNKFDNMKKSSRKEIRKNNNGGPPPINLIDTAEWMPGLVEASMEGSVKEFDDGKDDYIATASTSQIETSIGTYPLASSSPIDQSITDTECLKMCAPVYAVEAEVAAPIIRPEYLGVAFRQTISSPLKSKSNPRLKPPTASEVRKTFASLGAAKLERIENKKIVSQAIAEKQEKLLLLELELRQRQIDNQQEEHNFVMETRRAERDFAMEMRRAERELVLETRRAERDLALHNLKAIAEKQEKLLLLELELHQRQISNQQEEHDFVMETRRAKNVNASS